MSLIYPSVWPFQSSWVQSIRSASSEVLYAWKTNKYGERLSKRTKNAKQSFVSLKSPQKRRQEFQVQPLHEIQASLAEPGLILKKIWQKKRGQEGFLQLVCLSDDLYLSPNENENSSYATWPLVMFSQLHHDEMILCINICFFCVHFPYVSFHVTNFSSLCLPPHPPFLLLLIIFLNYTSSAPLSLSSVTVQRKLYAWQRDEDVSFSFSLVSKSFAA